LSKFPLRENGAWLLRLRGPPRQEPFAQPVLRMTGFHLPPNRRGFLRTLAEVGRDFLAIAKVIVNHGVHVVQQESGVLIDNRLRRFPLYATVPFFFPLLFPLRSQAERIV